MGSRLALFITANTKRITAVALAAAVVVSVAKFAVVTLLVHLQTHGIYLRLQDSILTGVLAAIGVWAGLMITRERRRYVLKQVEAISRLNHDLRNALEVILGSDYLKQSNKGEAILDSVERINRALDSILGTEPRQKNAAAGEKRSPVGFPRDFEQD